MPTETRPLPKTVLYANAYSVATIQQELARQQQALATVALQDAGLGEGWRVDFAAGVFVREVPDATTETPTEQAES